MFRLHSIAVVSPAFHAVGFNRMEVATRPSHVAWPKTRLAKFLAIGRQFLHGVVGGHGTNASWTPFWATVGGRQQEEERSKIT